MTSEPASLRAFFEDVLPKRLSAQPHLAEALRSLVGFHLSTSAGGKDWTVDLTPEATGPRVRAVADPKSECVLSLSEEDFLALTCKSLTVKRAFSEGRLKVRGDMGIAMKLDPLF